MQFLNRDLADERKEAVDKEKGKKRGKRMLVHPSLLLVLAKYKKIPFSFLVSKPALMGRRN